MFRGKKFSDFFFRALRVFNHEVGDDLGEQFPSQPAEFGTQTFPLIPMLTIG